MNLAALTALVLGAGLAAALIALRRRAAVWQRQLPLKIALAVLFLGLTAGAGGWLYVKSSDLSAQRSALYDALSRESLAQGTPIATQIAEEGVFELNGRTYGAAAFVPQKSLIFTPAGEWLNLPRFVEDLLIPQKPAGVPAFLLDHPDTVLLIAASVLLLLQLVVWLNLSLAGGILVGAAAALTSLLLMLDLPNVAVYIAGLAMLTFAFLLLTQALQVVFQAPASACAVAHTVVKEAARLRLSSSFIILLLLVLPLIPLTLDPDAPLRYQIQTFISRSMTMTFIMAACMTLFLSCGTVAFEIRDRQIWQLMTKPLNQFHYLLGKWLGVMAVNLVLLIVTGLSIFLFTQVLRERPAVDQYDALAVREQVLTARSASRPKLPEIRNEDLVRRVEQAIANDAELDDSLATKRTLAAKIKKEYSFQQRSVPPYEGRLYTFSGLEGAKDLESTITLRYQFHIGRSDEHETYPVVFRFNERDDLAIQQIYVPTMQHVLPIAASYIKDDGTIDVEIFNQDAEGRTPIEYSLNFDADDFEILYKSDSFEANFSRALMLQWFKLAFLAMLGIAAATLLSFPVACLLAFTLFMAGSMSHFLEYALEEYYPAATHLMQWDNPGMVAEWLFKHAVRGVCQGLIFMFGDYGEYRPTQYLVDGRQIPWSYVSGAALKIGVIWSGVTLFLGYIILRRRELATYSGAG